MTSRKGALLPLSRLLTPFARALGVVMLAGLMALCTAQVLLMAAPRLVCGLMALATGLMALAAVHRLRRAQHGLEPRPVLGLIEVAGTIAFGVAMLMVAGGGGAGA